jgi:hypothetical protein
MRSHASPILCEAIDVQVDWFAPTQKLGVTQTEHEDSMQDIVGYLGVRLGAPRTAQRIQLRRGKIKTSLSAGRWPLLRNLQRKLIDRLIKT